MKKSSLIFFEDKRKILKCRLLQFLFGMLRLNQLTQYKFMSPTPPLFLLLADKAEIVELLSLIEHLFT